MREDCINHVQKRVSSRLKDAWSKYSHVQSRRISITTTTEQVSSERLTKRGVFLSDGKPYSDNAGRMAKINGAECH
ncbi:unnamed protein product, partial [Rotaria magnacalcarata]